MSAKRTQTQDVQDLDAVVKRHKPPAEVMALETQVKELRAAIREYKREHGKIESLIHQVVEAAPRVDVRPAVLKPGKNAVGGPVDAVLHLSDIHYGAVQQADEVEGFGVFSPEIAEVRLQNLGADVLNWVCEKRKSRPVNTLHILMTGDYISGDVHEELRVTNAFPAPVQAVECGALLSRVIGGLASEFAEVNVHMTTDDNHGRLTKKPQAKEAGLNNYGYVVASFVKASFGRVPHVSVNVIPRPWESVACCNRRYLLTHGHKVQGWAGFPYYGIERQVAREAMKRMNAADIRKFHRVVMGHWHAPLAHQWYWIGGSVSGTDAFDHGQGRQSDPLQVSWMIHPEHGEFDRTEWRLRV